MMHGLFHEVHDSLCGLDFKTEELRVSFVFA